MSYHLETWNGELPRFRQRLLFEGGGEMHDDDLLGAMNLQLVILNFWPAKSKDVENLIWASEENYPEDLEVLLQTPLDPNIPDRDGRAALHSAAFAGHGPCLSLLLEASADKDAWEKSSGHTPLHVAALNGKLKAPGRPMFIHVFLSMPDKNFHGESEAMT